MMKLISAAAVLAIAAGANATVLYSTSFEAPTFAVGNINGQNGWLADTGTIANTAGGAHTGTQFGRMTATNLSAAGGSAWAWQATSSGTPQILRASAWFQMGGTIGTRAFSVGLDCYDVAVSRIGQILINSDGSVSILDGLGTSAASAAGLVNPNVYNKLSIEMNYTTGVERFFLNDVDTGFAGAFLNTDFGDADFRGIRSTTAGTGTPEMRVDDYLLETFNVPAPSALGLLGMGLVVGGRRRRA
ncbi:MAG: PEP-CTERM sorting domain-containing protein [Phycisphaerales bacterium]